MDQLRKIMLPCMVLVLGVFSAINCAAPEREITPKMVPDGWWSPEADIILKKFVSKAHKFVKIYNKMLKSKKLTEEDMSDILSSYHKAADNFMAEFDNALLQYFYKPVEDTLKSIEPCCSVAPFTCDFDQQHGGIVIYSLAKGDVRTKPDEPFCRSMLLSLNKQRTSDTIAHFFIDLQFRPDPKTHRFSIEQIKEYISRLNPDQAAIARKKIQEDLQRLTSFYKIHLMPMDKDLLRCIELLFKEIKRNKELQQAICGIKIKPYPEESLKAFRELHFRGDLKQPWPEMEYPKIAIYCIGQQETQRVLAILYSLYSGFSGLERAPGFNEKVNDLIYFTQGERLEKLEYPQWFDETKGKVYYKESIIDAIAGAHIAHDYSLKNPAK